MKMIPVDSSNLTHVGYEPDTCILRIRFKGGTEHDHLGVPGEVHSALMAADSHGAYYSRNIRKQFPSQRVSEAMAPPNDAAIPQMAAPDNHLTSNLADAIRRFQG